MQPTLVRRLCLSDWSAFEALRLEGLERHPEAFATSAKAWKEAPKEATEGPLQRSEDSSDDRVLGAFLEEQLVGLIGFRREQRSSVCHKGSLWGFYVSTDSRNRGAGTALVDAALGHARTLKGLRSLRIIVSSPNQAALRLFTRAGFRAYGLEPEGIRAGERFFDQRTLRVEL